LRLRP